MDLKAPVEVSPLSFKQMIIPLFIVKSLAHRLDAQEQVAALNTESSLQHVKQKRQCSQMPWGSISDPVRVRAVFFGLQNDASSKVLETLINLRDKRICHSI